MQDCSRLRSSCLKSELRDGAMYCGREKMEKFIKEGKNGFGFAAVSSSSGLVNANCLQIHVMAYNLIGSSGWNRLSICENSVQIPFV